MLDSWRRMTEEAEEWWDKWAGGCRLVIITKCHSLRRTYLQMATKHAKPKTVAPNSKHKKERKT